MSVFDDPGTARRYEEGPPRLVPGYRDLQRMALVLIKEKAPEDGRILVLGAGGGLELRLFAESEPGWRLVGVDPAGQMLETAKTVMGPFADHAELIEGTIDAAPDGPFDAATAILVFHFIPVAEKLSTLKALRRRLKPGAPFVTSHFSLPREPAKRDLWLDRYAAFGIGSGAPPENMANAKQAIGATLPIVSPEEDEALLNQAGFSDISLFYVGFGFRGWVATA